MKNYYSLGLSVAFIVVLAMVPHNAFSKKSKLAYPSCSEKMSVAVDTFRTENISIDWNDFSMNARDVVVNELVNSGCYRVLERGGYSVSQGFEREQYLRQTHAKAGQNDARSKNVKLAGKLVSFAMTGASKDNIGGTIAGLGGSWGGFGFGRISPKASKFCMTCRIYDSSTSEIMASEEVCKSKVDFRISGGGGAGFGVGGDFFVKSPLGQTIASAIHDCSVKLTNKIAY